MYIQHIVTENKEHYFEMYTYPVSWPLLSLPLLNIPNCYLNCLHVYTHGKRNTSYITRLNFGLTFPYILKVHQRMFLNDQHLFYLKLLQSENDEYLAITVAGSGHFGYKNVIFDVRTLLIVFAINCFHEV